MQCYRALWKIMQFEKKKNFFQSMLTWLILTHFKKYVQGLVEAVRPSVNIDTSFNLVFLNKSIKKNCWECWLSWIPISQWKVLSMRSFNVIIYTWRKIYQEWVNWDNHIKISHEMHQSAVSPHSKWYMFLIYEYLLSKALQRKGDV